MIKTQRLIIRKFNKDDAEDIFNLSQEKNFGKWLPDQVYNDIEQAEETLNMLISKYETEGFPYVLAVVEEKTGDLIGHVGLSKIEQGTEVGYAIGTKYQKNGFAKEALGAFIEWSKAYFGLKEILGVVDEKNIASERVLEASGFAKASQCKGKVYYRI
ncbi:MAG: GNAT family N-acetyltransferase [Eubacteriales bacterium]